MHPHGWTVTRAYEREKRSPLGRHGSLHLHGARDHHVEVGMTTDFNFGNTPLAVGRERTGVDSQVRWKMKMT